MLSPLVKKICPFVTLLMAMGCGKQINDPEVSEVARQVQGQEPAPTLILQINESVSAVTSYTLTRNAWFHLPSKLMARNASAVGKSVTIFYNLQLTGEYEFHCQYKSVASATELDFVNCQSPDNINIISNVNDLENMQFPMDRDTKVKLQLNNPTGTKILIDAAYLVDWK